MKFMVPRVRAAANFRSDGASRRRGPDAADRRIGWARLGGCFIRELKARMGCCRKMDFAFPAKRRRALCEANGSQREETENARPAGREASTERTRSTSRDLLP
jgi:hypothetical protein